MLIYDLVTPCQLHQKYSKYVKLAFNYYINTQAGVHCFQKWANFEHIFRYFGPIFRSSKNPQILLVSVNGSYGLLSYLKIICNQPKEADDITKVNGGKYLLILFRLIKQYYWPSYHSNPTPCAWQNRFSCWLNSQQLQTTNNPKTWCVEEVSFDVWIRERKYCSKSDLH